MKKRWEVFWLAEAGIILIYILLCLAAGRVLIAAGAAAAAVSVWCSLYYFTAHYTLSNILWEMRLTSPFFRGSVMSVLHTSGGNAVVFCDFSTRAR